MANEVALEGSWRLCSIAPMTIQRSRISVTRVALIVWACLSGLLCFQWLLDLGMVGFPDGYITPYARTTSTLLHVFVWACLGQSLYFACRALFSKWLDPAPLLRQMAVAAALTVVPVLVLKHCPRSQACSNIYEALTNTMMDDGTGG